MGCPYETFMSLTPKETECFYTAYRIKREQIDDISWTMGMYAMRAVSVALDHAFNGKKARSDYFDKPLMADLINHHAPEVKSIPEKTEDQVQKKREQLATMLSVMMYNARGEEIAKQKRAEAQSEVNLHGIFDNSADNTGSDPQTSVKVE